MKVELPHNGWTPRVHQMALWNYLRAGGKRAFAVWHRRAGKDEICLHHAAWAAMDATGQLRPCFTRISARSSGSIWSAVNPHTGKRRIDEAFPDAIVESRNDTSMTVKFINGSHLGRARLGYL